MGETKLKFCSVLPLEESSHSPRRYIFVSCPSDVEDVVSFNNALHCWRLSRSYGLYGRAEADTGRGDHHQGGVHSVLELSILVVDVAHVLT